MLYGGASEFVLARIRISYWVIALDALSFAWVFTLPRDREDRNLYWTDGGVGRGEDAGEEGVRSPAELVLDSGCSGIRNWASGGAEFCKGIGRWAGVGLGIAWQSRMLLKWNVWVGARVQPHVEGVDRMDDRCQWANGKV